MLNNPPLPHAKPADKRAVDMTSKKDSITKLRRSLKVHVKQAKIPTILPALAKRPVDDWTTRPKARLRAGE